MDTHEAIRKAKSLGLDLVEVSSNARPPVCKIVDYGKYKYDQKKLKKEQPKKTHRLKEVKFRPGIGENDYNMKVTRAESFLMDDDKVRIQLMFRGRQMAHKEVGFELMKEVKEDLSGVAHIDMEPKLTGRNITMMLSPLPKHLQKPKFKNHDDLPDEEDDEEFDPEDYEQRCMYKDKGGEKHCNANARALFDTATKKNKMVKKLLDKFSDYDQLKAKASGPQVNPQEIQ